MAGFVVGTPTTLLTNVGISAGGAEVPLIRIDFSNGVAFGEIQVDITIDASATAGADVILKRVVDTVSATNVFQILSTDSSARLNFVVPAGVYLFSVRNNDATYTVTINSLVVVSYTWS